MRIEPLEVPDAWLVTPDVHGDDRGFFLEWLRTDKLEAATGRRFAVRQANHSSSSRGVTRGIHFGDVPPGQAKLVYCPVGSIVDVVVDVRIGSPTYGRSQAVALGGPHRRAVFLSEGLGHGFCALEDRTSVVYLVSEVYNPATERTVNPLDPELAVQWPLDPAELVLSDKDREAPGLAEAARRGYLPTHSACEEFYALG